jgi:sigma-E factor negative regulatory protein RseC
MSDSDSMLEESAHVVEVYDDLLIAETQSRSGCSHCSTESCTTSVVAKLFGVRRNRLVMENSLGARPGDQVKIGISDRSLVRASLMAYLMPLLFMLGVTAVGNLAGVSEFILSLLALVGLAMGFFIVHWVSRGGLSHRYEPRLLRIVAPGRQWVDMPKSMRSECNERSGRSDY